MAEMIAKCTRQEPGAGANFSGLDTPSGNGRGYLNEVSPLNAREHQ